MTNSDAINRKQPTLQHPPEITEATENLAAWDESPEATGHSAVKITPDDDLIAEKLVNDGLDTADSELRDAAKNNESPDDL